MILNFLPTLISLTLGILVLNSFLNGTKLNPFVKCAFALGLGLAFSSTIAFSSFFIFQKYYSLYALMIHGGLIALLGFHQWVIQKKRPSLIDQALLADAGLFVITLISVGILSYVYGKFFPYGGWDAWQVWNFKAKFLFESTGQWKNMFEPVLWRSSPHYPLLLPLINVWGWTFCREAVPTVPFLTAILFNIATASLIFGALHELTRSKWSAAAALFPFLNAHYMVLTTAQYCDHVLGFFLCCAMVSFLLAMSKDHSPLFGLAGAFIGSLSFAKPEGTVASGLIFIVFTTLILFQKRGWKPALWLAGCTAVFFIPTLVFKFLLSPGNQTFINGLTSSVKPSSWLRMEAIARYFFIEFTHEKWAGLWIVLLIGFLTHIKSCFQKHLVAITGFLTIYSGIIVAYYWVNTYFEITWWLSVTLGRILISLLPLFIIWIGAAVLSPKK